MDNNLCHGNFCINNGNRLVHLKSFFLITKSTADWIIKLHDKLVIWPA
jgi:hypothetical protein